MKIRVILRIAALALLVIAVLWWYFGNYDRDYIYMQILFYVSMACFLASFLIGVNYFGRKPLDQDDE
ncbi:MAG TPA: hypothetical protein VH396_09565 [Chitinophagaceae bacterium]|jgi:uncharacterized membrane protein